MISKKFVSLLTVIVLLLAGLVVSVTSAANNYFYTLTNVRLLNCNQNGGMLVWDAKYDVPAGTKFHIITASSPGDYTLYPSGYTLDHTQHSMSRAYAWNTAYLNEFEWWHTGYDFVVLINVYASYPDGSPMFRDAMQIEVDCSPSRNTISFSNGNPPNNY